MKSLRAVATGAACRHLPVLALLLAAAVAARAEAPRPGCVGSETAAAWTRAVASGAPLPLPEAGQRAASAMALIECLDEPDPVLRDAVAYTSLAAWMRAEDGLAPELLERMAERLLQRIQSEDPRGFGPPFAALVLAEVARTDRIRPWMDAQLRARLVAAAADYLQGVRDYRGFVDGEGWRHGVAHGADFALQLALNPTLERGHLLSLRTALGSQVLAGNGHAYVFNEPARLATPLLFIAQRGLFDGADWESWLLALPPRIGAPESVWNSAEALARRHNLQALLLVLHFEASRSEDPGIRSLLPGLLAALKALP